MRQEMTGFWDGSGISWTICKQSASCSRQISTPAPHHFLTGRMLFLTPNLQCRITEGQACYAQQQKNIYAQVITIKVTTGHHHHHHGNSGSSCANILTAAIVSRSNTLQQYRHAFALPYFVWHSSNTHRETYELLYYRRLTASFPGQPG